MKILLDECIPRKLTYHLLNHDCSTVPEAGFAGIKNGALLSLSAGIGDHIFLTMDKGVAYEQNMAGVNIGVVIMRARSNRLADLLRSCQAV